MARPLSPLPESAAVVIIGGGVIGTSAAFHLAEAGVEVVLLERDQLGSGSTSRAAGGVRTSFSDELNVAIATRSLAAFREFARRPGWEIDLKEVGYLFALTRPEDVEAFARSGSTRLITVEAARERCPLLAGEDLLACAFCADAGHTSPEGVVQGYAFGARAHGARLYTGCEVVGIETQGGEIVSVATDRGELATNVVICAAGAWSRACGEMVGVELPVTPLRRQVLFTEAIDGLVAELPMTIDFETGFYFHREGPGLLMGMADPEEQPGFSIETTDAWIPGLMEVVNRRAPAIAGAGIRGGWAGLYEMTPDHNAIIGEAAGSSRFLYATGFSGHGFLQGPVVGEILRDLVLEREPVLDVAPLGVERFDAGALRPEFNVV